MGLDYVPAASSMYVRTAPRGGLRKGGFPCQGDLEQEVTLYQVPTAQNLE